MDSRERLIEAMSELIWRKGYAATTPREVRAASGVGQGSMYHHFTGKKDLAKAALQRNCAALLPGTLEVLGGPGTPMERLTGYLTRPLPALRGCRVGRMTQDPQVVADPELLAPVGEAFAQGRAALSAVIADAIRVGELPSELDAERLACTLTATIQGGYVIAIAAQDPSPFDQARTGALELLRAATPHTSHPTT